ncbi:DUF669 domain-containing protein [Acidithiobacillus sp. M4-SHS-6]|uniref:DUF669 domain-containing protein n=1 Tax=Acidithiobacillus sp. M4-SHS-6 TaxID=3383024 RepID=UPI0039BEA2B7
MVMVSMQGITKASTGISERIEPGIYDVQVTKVTDGHPLKGGQSGYGSRFYFTILNDGPMRGREIQHLLNVQSTKPDNLKYSLQELAGMAISSGVPESAVFDKGVDTQYMLNRQLSIVVGPQKDNPQYVEVKGYMPSGANQDPANWEKVQHQLVAPAASTAQGPAQTQGGWGVAPQQGVAPGGAAPQQQAPAQGAWGAPQGGQPGMQQPQASYPGMQQPHAGAQPHAGVQPPAGAQPQAQVQNTWGNGPS